MKTNNLPEIVAWAVEYAVMFTFLRAQDAIFNGRLGYTPERVREMLSNPRFWEKS